MKSLETLAGEEKEYLPSEAVRDMLSHVPLVCVVGGVGVGKNYLMHRSGLPIVGRVTSRPKRSDDDPSVYTYHTNEEFAAMIEQRKLVQYAVDLRNGTMYGSTPQNYVQDAPNLADIWHWSVAELPGKGFKSVRAVSIITPAKQWQAQLETRFAGRDEAFRKSRLAEAKESLAWSREQILSGDANHAVIINSKADTSASTQTLKDFAHGVTIPVPENALHIIDDMLRFLEQSA